MQERLIKQAHNLLLHKKKTIAVAESCTGGSCCEFLTRYSGSSVYFLLGVTAYSNASKNMILNIPLQIILKHGAVSQQTAAMMALSIRKLSHADIGIGITGIAGPTGAGLSKPVGTVFIAIDTGSRKICKRFLFRGSRATVRKKAALEALRLLCTTIR